MKKQKKLICLGVLMLLLCLAGVFVWQLWRMSMQNNMKTQGSVKLYIYPEDDFSSVYEQLSPHLQRPKDFARMASLSRYKEHVKTGYFEIHPGLGNRAIVRVLSQGLQKPVKIRFNNIRTVQQLSGLLSRQIMLDSAHIYKVFTDPAFLAAQGLTQETLPAFFLPDTYEVWWNASPERLQKTFVNAYKAFWNEERLQKAEKQGLTPVEVSIIASIIEEETNMKDEWPIVAGIYMNRLRRGMYLQACPTVKFALNDFSIKRVLKEHTEVDSPYNTYKHLGLPPGPVRIPSKAALDAVLNSEKHNYLYMCAKDDFSGRHYFSTNLKQHNAYANRYHKALNKRRIYK